MFIRVIIVLAVYVATGVLWMLGIMVKSIVQAGIRIGGLEFNCWIQMFNQNIDKHYGKGNAVLKSRIMNIARNIITWPFWVKEFRDFCCEVNKMWLNKQ